MQEPITPKVSVIVSSHRQEYIEDLLSSLQHPAANSVPAEIIVVADYTIDMYLDKYPNINWMYLADTSISAKRNRGIACAKGTICAFTDDDCIPDKAWISRAVEFLEKHPDMAGVEGVTEIEECTEKEGSYREFKRLEKPGYRTNNIFYRRNVLLNVTMFDERFTVQREDVDLAYSIIEAGGSVGYSDQIRVKHRFRQNENWDLLKNCMNRRFDPLLHLKHKKLYRKHIGSPLPPAIAIILLLHLLAFTGIALIRHSFMFFIGIDIFGIILFTIRRAGLPFTGNPMQWLREFISFSLSPFVLLGALIYGSIRFKHLFLF